MRIKKPIIGIVGATGFIGSILVESFKNDKIQTVKLRSDEDTEIYKLDHLIFCARSDRNIIDENGLIDNPTESQWMAEYRTDIYLPYQFSLKMINQNPGLKTITFISSIYGKIIPTVRQIPINYVTCKAAEIHLSKYLACKFSGNIRVNCLILGGVISIRKAADQNEDFLKKYCAKTLTGKMTQQNDIYPAIRMLMENRSMTGAEIEISGGYGLK